MRGFKKPKYSMRFKETKCYGRKTVPKISENLVLFRFPAESQTFGSGTQSCNSQRSSVDTPSKLNSPLDPQTPEYFVKQKYSLYRMGVGQKHFSKPKSIRQSSPVSFRKQGAHITKESKLSRSSVFGNKVLINRTQRQSYSWNAKQVGNTQESYKEPTGTLLRVPQTDNKNQFTCSKNKKLKYELCFFYTRFGSCTEKDCRFVHDPKKVFICRKFVYGSCLDPKCKLLHTREIDRLPVCLKFLSGLCGKSNCHFAHVNVGKNAEICKDFVFKGCCNRGRLCSKVHTWDCIQFWKTGQCSDIEKCPLRHKLCSYTKGELVV